MSRQTGRERALATLELEARNNQEMSFRVGRQLLPLPLPLPLEGQPGWAAEGTLKWPRGCCAERRGADVVEGSETQPCHLRSDRL